jgi:hypothetical protein
VKQLDKNSEDFRVIETMVKVADWRKADDITVLNLIGLSEFTNFMVIMEATSKPQNQAISAALEVRFTISYCLLFIIRCFKHRKLYQRSIRYHAESKEISQVGGYCLITDQS